MMIVGSNHLFEEHIFDMFVKRYKNILKKKSKRVSRTYKRNFFAYFFPLVPGFIKND